MTKDRKQLTLVICHKNMLAKCSGLIAQRYKSKLSDSVKAYWIV